MDVLSERGDGKSAAPERGTALGKAVLVLQAFSAEDRGVTFTELTERTGLPKSTLHRILGELVALKLVDRDGGRYRLGGGLFELGMRASVERTLLEVATPFMEDLYERTHETVHLGVREGVEVVYIAKFGGHRQAEAPSRIGGRLPLYCTAVGKAMLAHASADVLAATVRGGLLRRTPRTITAPGILRQQLDQVIATGVAFEFEESARGLVCVGSPVFEGETVVAAVSVAGPVTRFRPQGHADAVRAAAAGMSATLARRAALTHPGA